MKKLILLLVIIMNLSLNLFCMSTGTENNNKLSLIEFTDKQSASPVKILDSEENTGLIKQAGNCSVNVSTDGFTGTITFHDVGFFSCVMIKLIALFR